MTELCYDIYLRDVFDRVKLLWKNEETYSFCLQTFALLNKLLDGAHDSQVKAMESRQERECTDLRKNQVKQSVETSKNAGKLIKCKEEKERYAWKMVVARLIIGGEGGIHTLVITDL